MSKSFCCGIALCLFNGLPFAQTLRSPAASTYTGVGAYSLAHTDIFSFTTNQASLAQLKNSAIAVSSERKFLLSELNQYTIATGVITPTGNFGLEANYVGFTEYNETQLGLAYGRSLGKKLDVGVQFNYHGISISSGYGNATAISFELGAILHISEKVHAGIHINNPVGGKFGKNRQEELSQVYTFGFGYDASDKLIVTAEILKEENMPVNVIAAFQYRFIKQLSAKAGVSTSIAGIWGGFGLRMQAFRIDVTAGYHPQLGLTPAVLLLYEFIKQGK